MRGAKGREQRHEDALANGERRADGNRAPFGKAAHGLARLMLEREDVRRVAQERFACGRQMQLAAKAVEERRAIIFFKFADGLADGWLRDMERGSRGRHAVRTTDGLEDAEMTKGHGKRGSFREVVWEFVVAKLEARARREKMALRIPACWRHVTTRIELQIVPPHERNPHGPSFSASEAGCRGREVTQKKASTMP